MINYILIDSSSTECNNELKRFISKMEAVTMVVEYYNKVEILLDDKHKNFDVERDYLHELFIHYKIPVIKIYKQIYNSYEEYLH